MTWTADKPTAPGCYWVWQDEDKWPCRGVVRCVNVEKYDGGRGKLGAWVPGMDFAAPFEGAGSTTWDHSLWQGPIEAPAAPGVNR